MNSDVYDKSVIATGTNTNKKENQDCKGEFECEGFSSIFIADGLGSYKYARLSSERVINFFNASLRSIGSSDSKENTIFFPDIFRQAKQKLIEFSQEILTEDDNRQEDLFGTTVIAVTEQKSTISFAYVGNGAIWHIRGNFTEFPDSYLFPWNAVNILNPHTTPENGKEALYRLISDSSDFSECLPSIITIEKDTQVGELIIICTDGIYSADQLSAGKNDKGIWVKYQPAMLKLFSYLKHFFKTNPNYNKESFGQMLNEFLEELNPTLEDDATIGILVTEAALNYQNRTNWLNKNEINSDNEV